MQATLKPCGISVVGIIIWTKHYVNEGGNVYSAWAYLLSPTKLIQPTAYVTYLLGCVKWHLRFSLSKIKLLKNPIHLILILPLENGYTVFLIAQVKTFRVILHFFSHPTFNPSENFLMLIIQHHRLGKI